MFDYPVILIYNFTVLLLFRVFTTIFACSSTIMSTFSTIGVICWYGSLTIELIFERKSTSSTFKYFNCSSLHENANYRI